MFAEWLLNFLGDASLSLVIGLSVGILFGSFAQRSEFCLRAACIEFWRRSPGNKLAIWLIVFSTALISVQLLIQFGQVDVATIRQLASTGTLSGAIIGGSIFGVGMVLARGCASRLLVLSATGNLRALLTGLIVTITAQASLTGVLSPVRQNLSSIWTISAENRNLSSFLGQYSGLLIGVVLLVAGFFLARSLNMSRTKKLLAAGVGLAVVSGWWLTAWHASISYEMIAVKSVSFTGPSANTLMGLVNQPTIPLSFDTGLVPGVFLGSLIAALLSGTFKIQRFDADTGLVRYLVGAVLMGFGGMLAGGCAVGAGVTGGSVMALTAWLALFFMWLTAGLTVKVMDGKWYKWFTPITAAVTAEVGAGTK